jgi:O-antigen biosynthesis protein WbqP
MYLSFIKPLLDRFCAIFLLLAMAIPMLLIAIAVKITSKGPVFFKQTRVGIHQKPFEILKFRTMVLEAPHDVPTHALNEPEKWMTPIGVWLRRSSLDELPQLLNIVKGDMSFVGPRPGLPNQEDLITLREQYGANDMKPGLTGWAQINGRNHIEVSEKSRLDGEYVHRVSFSMDLRCILGTCKTIIKDP